MSWQDEPNKDRQDKKSNYFSRFLHGLGIVMSVLTVGAILLVGLVLGACFLGGR